MTPFDYVAMYWHQLPFGWQVAIEWIVVIVIAWRVLSLLITIIMALDGRPYGSLSASYFVEWSKKLLDGIELDVRDQHQYTNEQVQNMRDELQERMDMQRDSVVTLIDALHHDMMYQGMTKKEIRDQKFEEYWQECTSDEAMAKLESKDSP